MSKKPVRIFSLGGTIAMTTGHGAGVVPALSGDDLVAAVPQIAEIAEVSVCAFRQIPGAHLNLLDLEELAAEIRSIAADVAGIVITQGTDTIEETAFVLDLLLDLNIPVIVTGAMRNPTLPGADGPANLLASVRTALSNAARGLGVLVLLNDEIHSARFAHKAHTSSPSAFTSFPLGPVGCISEERVQILLRPDRIPPFPSTIENTEPRIALLKMGLGDDGKLIDLAASHGFDGIVVEGFGGGHVTEAAADAIERAAAHLPLVIASRIGNGATLESTYGFKGSEIDLARRGALFAGLLSGQKARLLLALSLSRGEKREGISARFKKYY